jgi:hypothetical protein
MVPRQPFYRLEFRTLLIVIASVAFVALISSYIVFQARFLIAGPQIDLTNEPGVQHNVRAITLSGTAHNITHLWLNDRQIFTDEAGQFAEALTLENGYTVATLKARDRFGRETRVERSFVYTPASLNAL